MSADATPSESPREADGEGAARTDPPASSSDSRPPPNRDAAHTCELCGADMYERHCKIVCPRCGYTRDCSDP